MNALESFWNLYGLLIYKKFYYDEYMKKSSFYDKCLNFAIAAASSASIASWLVWKKFGVAWAIIYVGI